MRTIQLSAAMLLVFSALFASTGCEDHYTTQEAYATCSDLTERNPATNPQTSFDDCVDCFETCGIDCQQADEGAACVT